MCWQNVHKKEWWFCHLPLLNPFFVHHTITKITTLWFASLLLLKYGSIILSAYHVYFFEFKPELPTNFCTFHWIDWWLKTKRQMSDKVFLLWFQIEKRSGQVVLFLFFFQILMTAKNFCLYLVFSIWYL